MKIAVLVLDRLRHHVLVRHPAVVWSVVGASGLLDSVNAILQTLLSNPNDHQTQVRIEDFVNTNKVNRR